MTRDEAAQLVAEVLTVDMNAALTAVDRLRALAGGSRDIGFDPSDAADILEKMEALAHCNRVNEYSIGWNGAVSSFILALNESYKSRPHSWSGEWNDGWSEALETMAVKFGYVWEAGNATRPIDQEL